MFLIRTPHATYAPDGASGGAAAGAAAGGAAAGGGAAAATMPEGLDVKFWDEGTKAVRVPELAKSYTELSGLLGKRAAEYNTDDFNKLVDVRVKGMGEDIKTRALAEMRGTVPKTPADYKTEIDAQLATTLPEGMRDMKALESDPLIAWWKGYAHKLGIGQEGFSEGIGTYLKLFADHRATHIKTEMQRMGENGPARITALKGFFEANLTAEHAATLRSMATSSTAVAALEALVGKTGDPKVTGGLTTAAGFGNSGVPLQTKEQIRTAMADPRYYDPFKRDPAYVADIDRAFKALNPD